MRQWFVGTALASLVAIWLMSTTLVPHRRRGISRRFRSGSVNRSAAVRGVSLSLQRDAVRRLVIPLPAGTPTASVPPSIAGVPSSILPACFTIVHVGTTNISELVAAAGGTADELGDVLMANPDLGWHALGIAQMQLYAQRHGHNYRLVVLEGDAVEFGPDQTARHPAWTRVPMLSNVYHDGAGAELLLNPECPAREQWLLYVDMDVVIGATNFSLEQIVRGYNASGQYHTGLPCQAEYDAGTFPTAANVTAANGTAGFCHNAKVATGLRKTLAPPLLVSDSAESVMMAFEDGYRNHAKCTSNAPTFSCPAMGGMPCSAVLLFRVPTPTRGGAAAAASTDGQPKSTQTRLLDVGRAMVDTWASARLEPGLTDPEDFLAMAWAGPVRAILVFTLGHSGLLGLLYSHSCPALHDIWWWLSIHIVELRSRRRRHLHHLANSLYRTNRRQTIDTALRTTLRSTWRHAGSTATLRVIKVCSIEPLLLACHIVRSTRTILTTNTLVGLFRTSRC
eukprot:m.121079 g.121079  ORF g.121079 m.121079 type:complete len:508 (-) comp21877_c0_seq3:941-2464(-)